ncbi:MULTISPECIES: OmpA family protein [unclassified Neisseria]|uniref:OmpA family protein n=1 Tax=unclassified Neisseria TaxID=2623750 RepID=UPI0026671171|nr:MULTISPECIES: OmpA family protein [unclassified Neisseria]MDO1509044.1 OmpA family protein [Neisseria sp. MVDL19-042950]MDO1515303.1 OmpA family protein [Neisseria sp. MVDL18-041461]MDO1562663.1 OmpA family protein [Neisseria sp. MVDL20-010259]
MKSERFNFLILLLFSELTALYAVLTYMEGSWPKKIAISILFVLVGVVVWSFICKRAKNYDLIGLDEWEKIQKALRNVEKTDTYVLSLNDDQSFFGSPVFSKSGATHVLVRNPEHLHSIASNLLNVHFKTTLALSIELSVFPALHHDVAIRLKDWLRNILFLQKRLGIVVPVNLIIHTPANIIVPKQGNEAVWYTFKLKERCNESDIHKFVEDFQQALATIFLKYKNSINNCNYVLLSQALTCLESQLMKQSDTSWSYINMRSISVVAGGETNIHSIWNNCIHEMTGGLQWPSASSSKLVGSPKELLSNDAIYKRNMVVDLGFKILSIISIAFILASALSAYNNSQLLGRLKQHIVTFETERNNKKDIDKQTIEVLKRDLQLLKKYQLEGIPSTLGVGLYRANTYIPLLEQLLATTQPMPQPTEKRLEVQPKKAVVLTLDSLALFETGQYELKHNANKALISVLKVIEDHPDTQILIEGHTDNVGNSKANLQLSEKRALAVRDWLVISSNLPVTRFAIKGYGDIKPVADNATEVGKAKNRRVEIILIPNEIMTLE